jgi:adenylyl- and sulfurtransferase ThiI
MKSRIDSVVIVRPGGEIGIKSRPVRIIYERMLMRAVRQSLKNDSIPYMEMWHTAGRIFIATQDGERTAFSAARVFGVSSASNGIRIGSSLDEIVMAALDFGKMVLTPGTFAVRCRRVGIHPYTSKQVEALLGEALLALEMGLKVNLTNPGQVLYVEVRDEMAILYAKSVRGPDGFPLGSQEPLAGVIDGTSDSVIACWCMMKRGSSIRAVVLSGSKGIPAETLENLRIMARWIPERKLHVTVVPYPDKIEGSLIPLRIAAMVAEREGIRGVVSGLHPTNLGNYREIMAFPICVFLPLAAMTDDLLESWANTIGVTAKPAIENISSALPNDLTLEGSENILVTPK